ncbi:hypothetical protein [Bradyrhizobium sp. ISRA443]|uniref:hypothetical protein n=2 Tax=Bradyrhizobium TaxID=374 RepID=UPI0032AFED19
MALDLAANGTVQINRKKGFCPMLKYYIKTTEALKRLRDNEDGVVSFEYVIVAACVVAAVGAAFGLGGTGPISTALSSAISSISSKVTAAVG